MTHLPHPLDPTALTTQYAALEKLYLHKGGRAELIGQCEVFLAAFTALLVQADADGLKLDKTLLRMGNRVFELYIRAHALPRLWADYHRAWRNHAEAAKPWEVLRDRYVTLHAAYIRDCATFTAALELA